MTVETTTMHAMYLGDRRATLLFIVQEQSHSHLKCFSTPFLFCWRPLCPAKTHYESKTIMKRKKESELTQELDEGRLLRPH